MTTVCIVGSPDVDLRTELFGRETARRALSSYDLEEPFANSIAVETVSLGAAVSLLNDLNWYLIRFAESAFVREPSVSETEWLSRPLATAVRDGDHRPEETAENVVIYGLEDGRLVEPLYASRRNDQLPEYDLRDVEDVVVVRITTSELERAV